MAHQHGTRAEGEGERKAEAEMRAGARAEGGVMSQDVGSGAGVVWWKGVPLTVMTDIGPE